MFKFYYTCYELAMIFERVKALSGLIKLIEPPFCFAGLAKDGHRPDARRERVKYPKQVVEDISGCDYRHRSGILDLCDLRSFFNEHSHIVRVEVGCRIRAVKDLGVFRGISAELRAHVLSQIDIAY